MNSGLESKSKGQQEANDDIPVPDIGFDCLSLRPPQQAVSPQLTDSQPLSVGQKQVGVRMRSMSSKDHLIPPTLLIHSYLCKSISQANAVADKNGV